MLICHVIDSLSTLIPRLLENSTQALAKRVDFDLRSRPRDEYQVLDINVEDDRRGITPEYRSQLARLFQPSGWDKDLGQRGLTLGSIVYKSGQGWIASQTTDEPQGQKWMVTGPASVYGPWAGDGNHRTRIEIVSLFARYPMQLIQEQQAINTSLHDIYALMRGWESSMLEFNRGYGSIAPLHEFGIGGQLSF